MPKIRKTDDFLSVPLSRCALWLLPAVLVVLAGCANDGSRTAQQAEPVAPAAETEPVVASAGGIVRYDRYTLVSLKPDAEQQDLLAQVIDTRIPADMSPTVRQAMQHVLRQSGFGLCATGDSEVATLYSRPLPAAHYHIGPVTLRTALQLLAGNAFALQVDEVGRQVCFTVRPQYAKTKTPAPALPVAQTAVPAPSVQGAAKVQE